MLEWNQIICHMYIQTVVLCALLTLHNTLLEIDLKQPNVRNLT